MLRFRALNDEDSSCSEAEDDTVRNKQTRESLEEDATALYNRALQLLCDSKPEEATTLLEEIRDSAYLNEDEDKSSLQTQMRLGCLKNLSIVYSADESRLESAQQVLLEAVEMDSKNVTLWSRLGHVEMKLLNYSEAYYAFQQGLKRSPHHWICIENLVMLAYVLGDYISCLHYCALGLEKDPNFVRGSVFRDEILEASPFVAESAKSLLDNWDSLFPKTPYDPSWRTKYLNQARKLMDSRCNAVVQTRIRKEEESDRTVYCSDRLKHFTLAELCQTVFDFQKKVQHFGIPTFSRPIDMSGCLRDKDSSAIDENLDMETMSKNINIIDDNSLASNFRGRSGSDERVSNENEADNNQACVNGNGGNDGFELQRSMGDEELSQSQQSQDAPGQEPEPKKKSRKDVKWWQYEGKRRSQRVRGHLMSVSQSPSKNERGFAETLKNLIPASLLCGETEETEEEGTDKTTAEEIGNYFGYQPEIDDVKRFILMYGKTKFLTVITQLAPFLCHLTNYINWPHELVTQYLESCRQYRLYRKEQSEWMTENDDSVDLLKQDALITLSMLEFRLDNCPVGEVEYLKHDSGFVADTSYLEIVITNGLKQDRSFLIRYYWFLVRYELMLAQVGQGKYRCGLYYLNVLENMLKEDVNFSMKLATKTDNVVSLEEVRKKIRFVKKMKNISRISELYQGQQYEALIDILPLCLTSEDFSSTDLVNRCYLAESYYNVGKYVECIGQCIKIVNPCLKNRNDEILGSCLRLIENICMGEQQPLSALPMREKRVLTNAMIRILTSNENKGVGQEGITVTPWCILHSILFNLESNDPALYLDEETAPNSVILLQFAHEFLNRSNKCCVDDGKLLTYTIDCLSVLRDSDCYGLYEETKHCIEQAIFCLYSHPSKKSKLKYLSEHNTPGIELRWSRCLQLYEYYKPIKIPEFDSYLSISADVEVLFQRILSMMPVELAPKEEDYEDMKLVLEGKGEEKSTNMTISFPCDYINIYYLLGDHYFKTKEWVKSVEYYTYDLTVIPSRFDSWAAIALAKAEMISSKLNACENYKLEDVIGNADVVVNCFRQALELEPDSPKIRIEFGSFVYAMHSFCSRLLKGGTEPLSLDKFEMVETKKDSFLKAASKCFELIAKSDGGMGSTGDNVDDDDDYHDELWIHHYMLGKVLEKIDSSDPEKFLTQYEMAGNRIREQGAPYPAKINFYNHPELAIEALEIYYRIHASILSYIEKHDYDADKEIMLSGFIERAASSSFVKGKQCRGGGGGNEIHERKRKAANEDASNKKEQAEIKNLMQELLTKVENMVASSDSSDSTGSSSDDDNDDATSVTSSQATTVCSSDEDIFGAGKNQDLPKSVPVMSSFGLSAFQEKMREKEIQESKATSSKSTPPSTASVTPVASASVVELPTNKPVPVALPSPDLEDNKYYKDFKNVKYGKIIAQCLVALEECILRFPQHHKSYFRIAYTYSTLTKNNIKITKEYLIGNPSSDKKKICGLFSDRKANNFFNGIWRNPIDDIDRPGSFPYHMSRTVQHLLEVLDKLNDHQLLAEVGIALSKVPEQDKQYLYNSERQQFSQQAFSSCVGAAKRFFAGAKEMKDAAVSVFETYQKLQKFNPKENVLASVLLDCYKQYLELFGQTVETTNMVTLEQAFKFFQHVTWASKTNPVAAKILSGKNNMGAPLGGGMISDNTSLISSFDLTGQLRGNDNRKKKDKVAVEKLPPKAQPTTVLPTVSTPSVVGAWNRSDKNFDVPVAKKKPRIVQTDIYVSGNGVPQKSSQGVMPKVSLPSLSTGENKLSQSIPPPRQHNPAYYESDEPEIIMDLSQRKNVNGQLKRSSPSDLDESDPLSLTAPKKPTIKKTVAATETPLKEDNSFALNNILSKMPITTSSTTATATSGGIPFGLFMDCMNKTPRSFDSLVETLSKQPNVQVPLEYVMTCANSGLPSTLLSNSSQPRTPTSTTSTAQVQECLQNIVQKSSSSNRIVTNPKPAHPQQQFKPQNFPPSSSASKDVRDRNKKLAVSTSSLIPGAKVSPAHTLGRIKSSPVPVSSFSASRNTSPFKAQSTIVSNPGVDEFASLQTKTVIPHEASPVPPPAHSGHKKTSEWGSSGDEPDVIDLTTPPRDKTENSCKPTVESSQRSSQKQDKDLYFMPKPSSSAYPLPPKKKIQARSRALSRESSEEPEVVVLD